MTDNPKFEIIEYCDYPEAARIEGDGWTVSVRYDDYPENPRSWTDCWIGTMMTSHRNYNFGNDDHDIQLNGELDTSVDCPRCEGAGDDPERFIIQRDYGRIASGSRESMESVLEEYRDYDGYVYLHNDECPKCGGTGSIHLPLLEYIKREYGATVILPLYLYEHSGITMSAGTFGQNPGYPYNDQWDAGMVGVIFDTPEQIEKTGIDPDPANIEAALREEIEEYDKYLRGEVFYVRSEIPGLEDKEEAIGGFVGEEWAIEQAKETAEWCDQLVQKEREERRNWADRDVVTTDG